MKLFGYTITIMKESEAKDTQESDFKKHTEEKGKEYDYRKYYDKRIETLSAEHQTKLRALLFQIDGLRNQLIRAKEKIRDQTEADIVVGAIRIILKAVNISGVPIDREEILRIQQEQMEKQDQLMLFFTELIEGWQGMNRASDEK